MSIFYNFIRKSHIVAIIEQAVAKKKSSLNLKYFEIDELPNELFECRDVQHLFLHNNKIRVLDVRIVQLCNITTLTIDYNKLTSLPPELGTLESLVNLNISYNPLKKLLPEIGYLKNLEVLWCNSIDIECLPEELGLLTRLDTFGARGNKIRQLPKNFTNLSKLRWLTLENNLLNKVPDDIYRLESLIHMNLRRNQLRQLPSTIARCRRLHYLFLNSNQIISLPLTGTDKWDLTEIKCLVCIDLRDNPIVTDTEFKEHFKYFPRIKTTDDWVCDISESPSNDLMSPTTTGDLTDEDLPPDSSGVIQNSIENFMAEEEIDSDSSSCSCSEDWENSVPSSQLDSTDPSDEEFEDNEYGDIMQPM